MTSRTKRDITALGAHCLPTRELLALAGVHADEVRAAEEALSLVGAARDVAVRALRSGPRVAAALELGRRAWMLPSPAGRRVRAPVDVAAICAPRFVNDAAMDISIALDRRLTVAKATSTPLEPALVLRATLSAGVSRVVIGVNRRGRRAVPTVDDAKMAEQLQAACALVDVTLLDIVLLGDDGFASLTRLGLLPSTERDPRYR